MTANALAQLIEAFHVYTREYAQHALVVTTGVMLTWTTSETSSHVFELERWNVALCHSRMRSRCMCACPGQEDCGVTA